LSNYKLCRPGDIVINRMSAYQGAVGIARESGIVSPEYIVLRPTAAVEPRFLSHLIKSSWFVGQMTARVRGIGSVELGNVRTPRINPGDLGSILVDPPPIEDQRAIADYLDTETARIDALIEKKQRMAELLAEREESMLAARLGSSAFHSRWIRLGQVLERIIDYRGATPEKTETGVPLVTASNVLNGKIDLEAAPQFISKSLYGKWMHRGFPRGGDLILTTEAPLGEVALIEDPHVALAQRLLVLRGRADLILPEFLFAFFRSAQGRTELLSRASGSTVMGVRTDRLREVPVQVPDLVVQREIVAALKEVSSHVIQTVSLLRTQIDLLAERRQALITAAVTGAIDISGVAA
jgi:type I restriction enzyme S subunit